MGQSSHIDSVDHGEQAEGAENLKTMEGLVEAPGMSQVEEQRMH